MNLFLLACAAVCIMLFVFIAFAFLVNMNSSTVSTQKKKPLANPVPANNSVTDSAENTSDNL